MQQEEWGEEEPHCQLGAFFGAQLQPLSHWLTSPGRPGMAGSWEDSRQILLRLLLLWEERLSLSSLFRKTFKKRTTDEKKEKRGIDRSIDDYSFFVVRFSFLWVMTMKREKTMILCRRRRRFRRRRRCVSDDETKNHFQNLLLLLNKNKAKNKRTRRSPTRTQNAILDDDDVFLSSLSSLRVFLFLSFLCGNGADDDFRFQVKNCFRVVNFSVGLRLKKESDFLVPKRRETVCLFERETLFFFFFFFFNFFCWKCE